MTDRKPLDQGARDRIVNDLDRNMLVEAGAGSGKTEMLARRRAAGVARGVYELEHMAAVTFTRKAAAELRGRFQQALERELTLATSAPNASGDEAARREQRIHAALANLERFFAGTIHSFCARLLRERPVEAGVSPGFTELDDADERLLREQSWRDYRAQAKAAGDPDLMELLDARISARDLDKAFETICLHEDVEFPPGDAQRPDARQAWAEAGQFWQTLRSMLPQQIDQNSTCQIQNRAEDFARLWRAHEAGDRDPELLARLLKIWDVTPKVVQKWWGDRRVARQAEALHEQFRATTATPWLTAWREFLYGRCVSLLTRARDAARADRLRRNALSFNDLLIVSARVLRENAEVRRALQQKYRWLFVDEFQDTDPVQAEIVFLLAAEEAEEDGAAGLQTGGQIDVLDWRTVTLRPGALFVVGDPKQSIYRFRRADIDIYNEVRARLGGHDGRDIVPLTTNFRSVPALCDWANEVFKDRFPSEPTAHAPRFAPLEAYVAPSYVAPSFGSAIGPVAAIDLPAALSSRDLPIVEADCIARYIRAEVDAGRRSFGDFLILTRKKRGLRPCAEALESLQIPIEVTGAGAFAESQEVRDLALLLKALADPQDAVALVGVLRGPLFGLSDRDLFAFRVADGYFNLFAEIAGGDDGAARVAAALVSLRQWHAWTHRLPTGAALERILEDSGYLALAATSSGGVEAGDLLHAIDRIRTVVEEGFTLADAADAIAGWCGLDEDGPEESVEVDSLPLEPGRPDVVRLMNLHKAKGLEAPVVFLADPLGGFEPRVDVRIVRDGVAPIGYFPIVKETKNHGHIVLALPQHWDEHEEAESLYLNAEVDRLLYVAATRARDLLVVGRYSVTARRRAWEPLVAKLTNAPVLPIPAAVAVPPPELIDLSPAAAVAAAAAATAAHHRAQQGTWTATSVTAEAKRLPRVTIELADAPDAAADPTRAIVPDTPSHRADAGMAWGTLIHGLLEHAMRHQSASREDLRRLAAWLTMEEPQLRGLIERALDTVERVAREPFWREARASAECHEEVPFASLERGPLVPQVISGVIDLVHRADAGWRVVDYKTDVDAAAAQQSTAYAEQVGAYVRSWSCISGDNSSGRIIATRQ